MASAEQVASPSSRFDLSGIEHAKVKRQLVPWLVNQGHGLRHAEDAAKVYCRLLDSWAYYQRNDLLQTAVDPDQHDPHQHLGPSFFSSQDQFLSHRLKLWTRHRFNTAVNVLRQHGLVCTQTRGIHAKTISKGAVFGGRARHWWLVRPTDADACAWAQWFNSHLDAAHKQRHHRRKHGASGVCQLDAQRLTSATAQSLSATEVLRISEHRSSENQRMDALKFSAHTSTYSIELDHLTTESSAVGKRPTPDSQDRDENSFQADDSQQPDAAETAPIAELFSSAMADPAPEPATDLLSALVETPRADDTSYATETACRLLPEHCRRAVEAAIDTASQLNANFCGIAISDADRRQLLATAAATANPQSAHETHWSDHDLIQVMADALSYAEAHYWYHQRPLRNPASFLNRALSGGIEPTTSSVTSDSYGTPELSWDPSENAFIANDDHYSGDNFPSYALSYDF